MIKFSIIVAVYNIEQYIDQCVESLVNQTYSNLEIILVNDGATDDSPHKLQEWASRDSRIIVVNKKNGGLSSARNEGLKHATGDYISYIDGDDWGDTKMYQKLAEKLKTSPDIDMLHFSYRLFWSEQKQRIFSFGKDENVYDGPTFFARSNYSMAAWSKIYRREFLTQIGLVFLEGRLHEDLSYTIPLCMLAKKASNINVPLLYYRQNRPGSIMTHIKDRNVNDFTHAVCFGFHFLKGKDALTSYYCKWVVRSLYYSCLTSGTDYATLARCMRNNGAENIVNEIDGTSSKQFYFLLFIRHQYMKLRTRLVACKKMVGLRTKKS